MVWSLDKEKVARLVPMESLDEFVQDTLKMGMCAVADGVLYANTFKDLIGDQFTLEEVKVVS